MLFRERIILPHIFIVLFLAIPIILGANVLSMIENYHLLEHNFYILIIGIFTSTLTGYYAIGLLYRMVKSNQFWMFSIYCLIIGMLNFILSI